MTVPDFVGEVEGYRMFKTEGVRLKSTGVEWLWTPGDQEAMCLNENVQVRRVHRNLVNPDTGEKQLHLVELCTHGLIPSLECNCGIWMLKDAKNLIEKFELGRPSGYSNHHYQLSVMYGSFNNGRYVAAKVKGWGRCIEGHAGSNPSGWRCEFARIEHLVTGDPPLPSLLGRGELLESIAKYYNVPIVVEPEFTSPDPADRGIEDPRTMEWNELVEFKKSLAQQRAEERMKLAKAARQLSKKYRG